MQETNIPSQLPATVNKGLSLSQILFWIAVLVCIDQAIKLVINAYYLDLNFEIIPGWFEFRPVFNTKGSYMNHLLSRNAGIDLGMLFHKIIVFCCLVNVIFLYDFIKTSGQHTRLFEIAFLFIIAGILCALISHFFWENGVLDYIYFVPFFVFDLKDMYVNVGLLLFCLNIYFNREILKLKTSDMIGHGRKRIALLVNMFSSK